MHVFITYFMSLFGGRGEEAEEEEEKERQEQEKKEEEKEEGEESEEEAKEFWRAALRFPSLSLGVLNAISVSVTAAAGMRLTRNHSCRVKLI